MGNYNPHAPRIIGQEWVPIREENLQYAPSVNTVELGTTFTLTTPRQVRNARFYINQLQATGQFAQCGMVNIYPLGTEDETGPISKVIIPVSSGSITGNRTSFGAAASVADALYMPGDGKSLASSYTGGLNDEQAVKLFFPISNYPELANKRILNVSLLYAGYVFAQSGTIPNNAIPYVSPDPGAPLTFIRIQNDTGLSQGFTPPTAFNTTTGTLDKLANTVNTSTSSGNLAQTIATVDLGDINNFWDTTQNPGNQLDKRPWRYAELLRFEASSANRQGVYIRFQIQTPTDGSRASAGNVPFVVLDYVALQVTYCEEKRVAYGAKLFGYNYGMNSITLVDTAFNTDPILPAGTYLPTLSWVSPGIIDYGQAINGDFPQLNAVRELYQLSSHLGTRVNVPFPLTSHLGETFTSETTHVLPQLTMHASGGTLVEPHVYGRQSIAQVFGTVTATQEIQDGLAGSSASWPWVRYIARRFGDTTQPLLLTIGASTASISVSEFDALTEILDGWKAVTLRFTVPPVMGTGTQPQVVWSAASETAGNRWEVLAAQAPAISGTAGNLLNKVPSPNQLSVATYGQPVSGGIINLGWINGWSPLVTATTDDDASDAFVIFAQDMPTVTGFSLSTLSQAITGIGLDCGIVPCAIPSAILYSRIIWSPTSNAIPATGFGYYEMQRMDTVETTWATIMKASSPFTSGFSDYESRIGILTSYRIRSVDEYEFPGAWSSTITSTIPTPGVSGGCISDGHILVFSSNERQSGAINLAYSSAWMDSQVSEDFVFPEASFVQMQAMYNEDFFTAFRPLERGGEQFTRTVLVQAAAIAPETLADFTSLRNMAWDTVSYICVRDEDGNRWFATVTVPSGRVLNDRRLYLAPVNIIEVTATPSPADPSV